ncbi:MAG TPA: hypothetical protein VJQ44_05145 [Gemmatimonadales bacterium]|nr:hypothetical protein [Gemmatimonadales bacterium]
MNTRTLNVPLKGFGAAPTDAEVQLSVLDPGDRVKRAGVVFLAFLLVALGAIPIPLVHFVLVPLALLLGFGFGANRLRQREIFRHVEGRCPFCGTEQTFTVMGPYRLPKRLFCGNCQRELELTN